MQDLTYNDLPKAVSFLTNEVSEIKKLLLERTSNEQIKEADSWFDINELCEYLPDKPAKATVYGWVHTSEIPYHKGKKKLRFLRSEIDEWLKLGRRKTLRETATEANSFLKKQRNSR